MTRSRTSCTTLIVLAALLFTIPAFPQTASMDQANRAYQGKNWQAAASALESITRADPSQAFAWLHLGISRHRLGQYDQAIAAYKHIEKDPQFGAPALYREAASLARLNRKSDALAMLDKAVDAGFARPQIIAQDSDLAALQSDAGFAKIIAKADTMAHPCAHQPEYRQFDFWIGEWDVKNPAGQPAGQSSVQQLLEGCALYENWTDLQGGGGKSLNSYNVDTKQWQQFWTDQYGRVTEYRESEWINGSLRFSAHQLTPQDALLHMTFTPINKDLVRQFGEMSTDGGKTWSPTFDLYYHRRK